MVARHRACEPLARGALDALQAPRPETPSEAVSRPAPRRGPRSRHRGQGDACTVSKVRIELPADLAEPIARRAADIVLEELEQPEWITLEQAAVRYQATPAALRWRARQGRLPGAVKDEGRWILNVRKYDAALMHNGNPQKRGRTRQGARPDTRRS